jgi:hypothetical protein
VCSQCRWRRGHGSSLHQEAKEHAQRSPLSASVKHRLLIWISHDLASVCRTPSCSITLTFASINAQRRANGLRIGGREPLVFTPPRCDTRTRTLPHCLHPSTQLHRPLARATYLSCPTTFSLLRLPARGMRGRLHAPILMSVDTHVAHTRCDVWDGALGCGFAWYFASCRNFLEFLYTLHGCMGTEVRRQRPTQLPFMWEFCGETPHPPSVLGAALFGIRARTQP